MKIIIYPKEHHSIGSWNLKYIVYHDDVIQ